MVLGGGVPPGGAHSAEHCRSFTRGPATRFDGASETRAAAILAYQHGVNNRALYLRDCHAGFNANRLSRPTVEPVADLLHGRYVAFHGSINQFPGQ